MNPDPWLDPLLPLVLEQRGTQPVLELGCGGGRDTAILAAAGCFVVGVERSAAAIDEARARVPSGEFHCQDIRAPFPAAARHVGVVVASLSLHYFTWDDTLTLVARIRQTLRPGGLLLCRLNSINDHHHGATGHPPIAANYFLVDGEPKRFFDRVAVEALFARGWRVWALEEKVVHRYAHPKALWEAVLERAA